MQGLRCPRVCKSTTASSAQSLLRSGGCFPSAQPHRSPQVPLLSHRGSRSPSHASPQQGRGGETATSEKRMALAAERDAQSRTAWVPTH